MSENTKLKTRCPKKDTTSTKKDISLSKNYMFSETEVAKLANCSVSYVKKLRSGVVDTKSNLAQRVLAIDELANNSKSILIQEIERIVKL